MRAILFVLSLLLALGGGIYLSKFISPVWLSADMHRPLDEIADEIVSDSQFGPTIDRTIEGVRAYYQNYAKKLDVTQKARILAVLDENEENLRKEMKARMRQFLIQSLSREELIEIKNFYKTRAGRQLNKLSNSPQEQVIYGLAFESMNKEAAKLKESASATIPASTPASAANLTSPASANKQAK
ncbi:MAG: DUF2059 domain-containing protein [Bdellovibrionia bacterium]